ncbi:unnamed protein product [Cuscuta campestris]|uniref:DUF6598 domain-containing protein n=1 Tax=Cuscuta campestris TaxID=132261 RepID=A0A484LEI8_9ASTE|nr:unnamed protein product [Cuscuta campestris]
MSFHKKSILELKVDLKDVGGKFQSRGFATYDLGEYKPDISYNSQIWSVFPGKDGFCALHYSMFSRAYLAKIEITLKVKSAHSGVYKIYGSAIAQYSDFDYSTKFKEDYFRSVLFKRTEKDPVQLKDNGRLPLSQCAVAVPMDSSLIIAVDFRDTSLTDHFLCKEEFSIGCCSFSAKANEHELDIKLTWSDGLGDENR